MGTQYSTPIIITEFDNDIDGQGYDLNNVGNISASSITVSGGSIQADCGNSDEWCSTHTTVAANSSVWNQSADISEVAAASGGWNSTQTTVNTYSAAWAGSEGLWVSGFDGTNTTATLSSQFDIALAPSLSASGTVYGDGGNSVEWNSTYTTVNTNSASWEESTDVAYLSAQIDANTDDITNVALASGGWDSTETTVAINSADWANHFDATDVIAASGGWDSTESTVATNSGNWNSTYTTVNTNSASWDTDPSNIAEIVYVATSGSEFTSIQSAIDSINDANSITKPYIVAVYPGVYSENITLKEGVSLRGLGGGPWDVRINPSTGVVLTWAPNSTYSQIDNILLFGPTIPSTNDALIAVDNGTHLVRNCALQWIIPLGTTSSEIVCISAAGDTLTEIRHADIVYSQTGNTAPGQISQRIIKATDTATSYIIDSNCTMSVGDSADKIYFAKDRSTSKDNRFYQNNSINIVATNTNYSGKATIAEAQGGTDNLYFLSNHLDLSATPAPSASNHAAVYEIYKGTGDTIHSTSNYINVVGFGSNYLAKVDATGTIVSHFDDATTLNKISGLGTFDYVYSPTNGNLEISNSLIVEDQITISSMTSANTVMKTNTLGTLQETSVTITDGLTGGSIIGFAEFAENEPSGPQASELLLGDVWITDGPGTSAKMLKYYDGTDIYSVELNKE